LEGTPEGWFEGRFSLFGGDPFAVFQSKGKTSRFDYLRQGRERSFSSVGDPLALLQTWLDRFRPPSEAPFPDLPFLYGGIVGFFSYELVRQLEKIAPALQSERSLPDLQFLFLNHFVLFDHSEKTAHLIYNPLPEIELGVDRETVYREGREKIEKLQRTLEEACPDEEAEGPGAPFDLRPDITQESYIGMVKRAKEYIAAGDIFQANLSQRFTASTPLPPFEIYRRLRKINPSPFSAYLNLGEIEIASGSPERLVRLQKGSGTNLVETRPIAGTRPRGKTPAEDAEMIRQLYQSDKERAEHLMLVDLERNDLGKICRYGSVRVESLMAMEKYSHVFHLVSQVSGELAPGRSPVEVVKALFPGGTITGVPKIRCMQIISELEKTPRGIYTGAVGYLSFSGEIDLNIAIRTWVRHGALLTFQVGAGIVADSDPESEYQETLQKAAALMKALQP
ncbi:MAG TPA: aminodeoxychorismate synthase component I, partial [Candidatus Manganitrophaceae bacterium]|nr:aminodeoxychorismate synthase component I [Candidatus Manganitrophaceae bacterium]